MAKSEAENDTDKWQPITNEVDEVRWEPIWEEAI
jgi:hypothetical protein